MNSLTRKLFAFKVEMVEARLPEFHQTPVAILHNLNIGDLKHLL